MKLAKRQVYNYRGKKVTRPAVRPYGSGLRSPFRVHEGILGIRSLAHPCATSAPRLSYGC